MPAHIVDELDDFGQAPAALNLQPLEVKEKVQTPAADTTVVTGEGVPDKYQGKTAAEMLQIVRDQESHIGKQGQELGDLRGQVGTLRGLVDKSLELRGDGNIGRPVEAEEELLTDDDFITTPRDAVSKTVQRETRDQQDRLARLEHQTAANDFTRRHPAANDDVNDEKFIEFVKKSTVRTKLATDAFGAGPDKIDFDAAEELWALYDDYNAMRPKEPKAGETEAVSTETPSQEGETPGSKKEAPTMISQGSSGDVGASSKPIYSQMALNRLQASDPDTYWASDTQAKVNEARADGRVKDDT